jgi:predicted regulator of Ras-like GTPase activity (Roadblock/LC7/MglB family)
MMEVRRELDNLARLAGAQGALVMGRDGLLLESTLEHRRAEALSAVISAAYGSAEGLGTGVPPLAGLDEMMIEAEGGTLYVTTSGPHYLLTIIAGPTGNMGVIRLEMRQAAERLATS